MRAQTPARSASRREGAGRRGTNLPRMGDYNTRVVLDQIRRARHGVSRSEMVPATGLSAQTISNAVARLIDAGLVVEGERAGQGRGKPRTLLHVRSQAGHAIGVHIDPLTVSLALVDLAGAVVTEAQWRTPPSLDEAVDAIVDQVARARESGAIETLHGLGVAAPGPIDADGGRVVHPPLLEDWGDVPLRTRLARGTGLPTVMDKDVSAAMTAELWHRNHDLNGTTLFAYLGYGVGFAFAREGELLPGSSRNAGECGHLIVDPGGPPCECGRRGCLGVSASMAYLIAEGRRRGVLPAAQRTLAPWEEDETVSALVAHAAAGEKEAIDLLRVTGERIAHGVVVVSDLMDVDHVVFGGLLWDRLGDYVLPAVEAEFRRSGTMRELHGVTVDAATLGSLVGAVGAASLVLDQAFTPKAATLVAQGS